MSNQETACAFCVRLQALAKAAGEMGIEAEMDTEPLRTRINDHFRHFHMVEVKPYFVEQ